MVFCTWKAGFDVEAKQLTNELKTILGIASLKKCASRQSL